MGCDMCGRQEDIYRTVIEDVELSVCEKCAKFGKVLEPRSSPEKSYARGHPKQSAEKTEALAENFSQMIKSKRESLGMTQKEFAMKINEKESIVHKLETGEFEPPIQLARKLEKILRIKIVEEYEETNEKPEKAKTAGFTIGDFIKIK